VTVNVITADALETITGLLDRWGYWIVFLGVMLENAGVPLPGETILLAAGFFASRGHLSVAIVAAVAAAGAILGDNLGYWMGRKLGRSLVIKYGKYVWLTDKRFADMERFFERHGAKTVAVARFITGFRVFTALFAGASHMMWRRFLFFNAIGGLVWAAVITLVGYFFGHSWSLMERWVKGGGLILAAAVVTIWLASKIIRRSRSGNKTRP
jgi:membrane protein DedA with SNARE-associated domain